MLYCVRPKQIFEMVVNYHGKTTANDSYSSNIYVLQPRLKKFFTLYAQYQVVIYRVTYEFRCAFNDLLNKAIKELFILLITWLTASTQCNFSQYNKDLHSFMYFGKKNLPSYDGVQNKTASFAIIKSWFFQA